MLNIYRRFGGMCYLLLPECEVSSYLGNVYKYLPDYTATKGEVSNLRRWIVIAGPAGLGRDSDCGWWIHLLVGGRRPALT